MRRAAGRPDCAPADCDPSSEPTGWRDSCACRRRRASRLVSLPLFIIDDILIISFAVDCLLITYVFRFYVLLCLRLREGPRRHDRDAVPVQSCAMLYVDAIIRRAETLLDTSASRITRKIPGNLTFRQKPRGPSPTWPAGSRHCNPGRRERCVCVYIAGVCMYIYIYIYYDYYYYYYIYIYIDR